MKYRKKPVVIDAIQWIGSNWYEIDQFITVLHETYPSIGIINWKEQWKQVKEITL